MRLEDWEAIIDMICAELMLGSFVNFPASCQSIRLYLALKGSESSTSNHASLCVPRLTYLVFIYSPGASRELR